MHFYRFQSQEKSHIYSMHIQFKLDFSSIIWYLSILMLVRLFGKKEIKRIHIDLWQRREKF